MWSSNSQAYASMSITFVIISLVLAFAYSFLTPHPSTGKLPRGPLRLPLLGNVIQWIRLTRDPNPELIRLSEKYGGMCMLWLGTMPTLIINSPRIAKELFDKRGAIYSSRSPHRQFAKSYKLLTLGTGEHFRRVRKLYQMMLAPGHALELRKYQDSESKITLLNLLNNPEGFFSDQNRYALSVVFSACYGIRLSDMAHPIARRFLEIWFVFSKYALPGTLPIDYFPILLRLPDWAQPWKTLALQQMHRENVLHTAFLRKCKDRMLHDASAPACFAASVLAIQEKEGLSDEQVSDIMSMLVGAGSDTTATFLQAFFKIMARYPAVTKKAQAELDAVVGPSRLPTFADQDNLPYIQALIKEIHRWAPGNGLGIAHYTTEEDTFEGLRIPKGTMVLPSLVTLSRDPSKYTSSDPDLFDPQRFVDHRMGPLAAAIHPDYMVRDHYHYGFGRRLCPGIAVAEASLFIVVSRVLWGFNISPRDGQPPLDMEDRNRGLVRKLRPFVVDIRSRGGEYEGTIRRDVEGLKSGLLDFGDVKVG